MANQHTLSVDFETFSEADIKLGLTAYFADPKARLLCMAWAFDDDEPQLWWAPGGNPYRPTGNGLFPLGVWQHVRADGLVRAWNANFEWRAWNNLLTKLPSGVGSWPELKLEQLRCTQAEAVAMGFPMALGRCGAAMGLDPVYVKDPRGAQLMRLCSIPAKRAATREEWEEYGRYCQQDVISERAIAGRLMRLPEVERRVWRATQRMNARGVAVDVRLARAVAAGLAPAILDADKQLATLTDGAAVKATQRARIQAWVLGRGVPLPTLAKRSVDGLLAAKVAVPADVRAVLELRREWALASPRKLGRLLAGVRDGALHDHTLYHGAHTGRFSSVGVQLQNLLRPPKGFDPADAARKFLAGRLPPQPMQTAGALIRHLLVARDGCELTIGDYSRVEAIGTLWLAGARDWLDRVRRGEPIYEQMASAIFGRDIGKDDPERQTGKITFLGCGYQLGPFGLSLQLPPGTPFHTAERCVSTYREGIPEVPWLWRQCERACLDAIETDTPQTIGKGVWFGMMATHAGPFLYIRLPTGRRLYYFRPEIETDLEYNRKSVTFWGPSRKGGGSFGKRHFYGGFIVENIVQGFCRDLMCGAMLRMEKHEGWDLWLTVHDEIVVETPTYLTDPELFKMDMEYAPDWLKNFPLTAEVRTAKRYGKA